MNMQETKSLEVKPAELNYLQIFFLIMHVCNPQLLFLLLHRMWKYVKTCKNGQFKALATF